MRKSFLIMAAIVSLAMLMPQKASAIESYGTFWVGDIQYYFEVDNEDFHYAVLTAFKLEVTGHVVIPETFEFNPGTETQTWTVTSVSANAFGAHCNVTSVDLPGTILSVADESFINSPELEYVIIRANVPPVVYNSDWQEVTNTQLFNTEAFKGVYVPNAVVQDYKNDSNWGKSKIYPITEFQGIESPSLQGRSGEASKVIRNGMLLIEKNGKTYNALGTEVK